MKEYWIYFAIILSCLAPLRSPDGVIAYFVDTPITALLNTSSFFAICAAGSLFVEWIQKNKN